MFKLPEGVEDGQIFFEGAARLFAPDGTPWPDESPQTGWVTLPADKPGPWRFVPVDNQLVSSRNIPPFFAAESAAAYFDPGIPWERQPVDTYTPPAPDQLYADGVSGRADDQGVHLTGKRFLTLAGGEPHTSGDGLRFLPFKQGTIEFWMRPNWHTSELPKPKASKCLVYLPVTEGHQWSLWYYMVPRVRNSLHDFMFSHVLYGHFYTDGEARRTTMRAYRRTLFEPGEWVHIAWVWGPVDGVVPKNPPYHTKVRDGVFLAYLFVDGRLGNHFNYRWYKNEPCDPPTQLQIGRGYASANIDAVIDQLRVSDIPRYTADFHPPGREAGLEPDEHTRALFHFDGDLEGHSHGHDGPLPVTVGE